MIRPEEKTRELCRAVILETDRLVLRPLTLDDRPALCAILQDDRTMIHYGGAFDEAMTDAWLKRQLDRYEAFGIGLWAVIRKSDGVMIGQCGLTWQPWKNRQVLEIGYLFNRKYWHLGYAAEAAAACRDLALDRLQAEEVCCIIRDSNEPSQKTALRIGMKPQDGEVRHYRGQDMLHTRYVLSRRLCEGQEAQRERKDHET